MAFNIFQAQRDMARDNQNSFDDAYDRTGKVYSDIARRKAGTALAQGDRAGAEAALGADGDAGSVRQLQSDQAIDDQHAFDNQRRQHLDATAEQGESGKAFLEALDHVAQLPFEERAAAMHHPVWESLGLKREVIDQLKPEDLSDESLAQFREQVKEQIIQLGNGGIAAARAEPGKPATLRVLREPEKPLILRQGDTLMGDDNRPSYTAPKTFAPSRGRSGGGGGGGTATHGVGLPDIEAELRRRKLIP